VNAAAVSVALLLIAFVALFALRVLAGRGLRRQEQDA
jgi:sulfate transport system permease protein